LLQRLDLEWVVGYVSKSSLRDVVMTTATVIGPNAKKNTIDLDPDVPTTVADFLARAEVIFEGCSINVTRDGKVQKIDPTEIKSFLVASGDEIAVTSQNRGA
jgi:hypothetical protein